MPRKKRVSTASQLLLTIPDVAVQLAVCRETVYKLINKEGLPTVPLIGALRVHPDSLQEWIKQRERTA